jgi:hypothetical protein
MNMKRLVLISLLAAAVGVMAFIGCERPEPIDPTNGQPPRANDSLINQQLDTTNVPTNDIVLPTDDTTTYDCTEYWDTFPKTIPNENIKIYLDSLFSSGRVGITYEVIGRDTVYSSATDTMVGIIRSNTDFEQIGGNMDIDFSKYCIVYGRIIPNHSGAEISFDIRQCSITSETECIIQKREFEDSWTYVFPKYFWGMYDSHFLEGVDNISIIITNTY